MNRTNELLDAIAARHGVRSDYAVAKVMGSSPQRISSYRVGRTQMLDEIAVDAAKLAGELPAVVICEIRAERATTKAAKDLWLRLANLARANPGAFQL